jgi:hypothetical protein
MTFRRWSTSTRIHPPSVLVAGCEQAILERCRVAGAVTGVQVLTSEVGGANALATERRAFAVIVPNGLPRKEWVELSALVRNIGATLIEVDPDVCEREIEAMIAGAIDTYLRRGTREGAGRYSIIGKGPVEVVTLRRDPAPARAPATIPPVSGLRAREVSDTIIFEEVGIPHDMPGWAAERVAAR